MGITCSYPEYEIDLTSELLEECAKIGIRLASEAGFVVRHKEFMDTIRKKPGIKVDGERVYFNAKLIEKNVEKWIARMKEDVLKMTEQDAKADKSQWSISCGGFSMNVLDVETDEVRNATCQDLRDLIRLVNSYGIGGSYPVMPQDLPPLMRAVACFKICFESSDSIQPYDYLDIRQTRFIYEMHRVMSKTFDITLCVPRTMMIDEKDIEIFLKFYPDLKRNRDINFNILDYPMLGITKPVTLTGSIALYIAEMFSIYTLFNEFDPELEIPVNIRGGLMTDMRHVCWAWGSPRQHLMNYLNSRILPALTHTRIKRYTGGSSVLLESSSSMCDEQAALEKMGVAMVAAMQGARNFTYAGSLCVDDLFSAVQFVIDMEIMDYIRETIESFSPHPDIISMDGIYDVLKDASLGNEQFLTHPDTAAKFRNIMPSSVLLAREKLMSWLGHRKTLKERAREECIRRLETCENKFHLDEYRQKALDDIYIKAEKVLLS